MNELKCHLAHIEAMVLESPALDSRTQGGCNYTCAILSIQNTTESDYEAEMSWRLNTRGTVRLGPRYCLINDLGTE